MRGQFRALFKREAVPSDASDAALDVSRNESHDVIESPAADLAGDPPFRPHVVDIFEPIRDVIGADGRHADLDALSNPVL
ncbi:hypothetical protein D9M72_434400 [compost metagenome]